MLGTGPDPELQPMSVPCCWVWGQLEEAWCPSQGPWCSSCPWCPPGGLLLKFSSRLLIQTHFTVVVGACRGFHPSFIPQKSPCASCAQKSPLQELRAVHLLARLVANTLRCVSITPAPLHAQGSVGRKRLLSPTCVPAANPPPRLGTAHFQLQYCVSQSSTTHEF